MHSLKDFSTEIEGGFEIDIQQLDLNTFNRFIETYEILKAELTELIPNRSKDILEIKSTKKLSTGEKALIDLYSSIYDYLKRFGDYQYNENCIFLLDEADLGFHPEWKKKYINALINTLPVLISSVRSKIKNIQIIFATHDPLTLSDIPNRNVAYIKKDGFTSEILSEHEKPTKSFGANITDLLADSFFIKDGLIGDFAKEKIEETISWLNSILELSIVVKELELENIDKLNDKKINTAKNKIKKYLKNETDSKNENFKKHFKLIEIIDEPFLRTKLEEMYAEATSEFLQKEILEKQIAQIQKQLQELSNR